MFDGKKLKQLRKAKGLTQPQLAEKLGYSYTTVSNWELGDTQPSVKAVETMAGFFGVDALELKGVPW